MANGFASRDDVRAMGDDVITRVSQLMAVERSYREQQHQENQLMMRTLLAEAKATNGRVTRLEAVTQTLKDEFQAIRGRWHAFRDSVQLTIAQVEVSLASVAKSVGVEAKGELMPVTRLDIKTAVGIFCLGMAAVLALLKLGKGLI